MCSDCTANPFRGLDELTLVDFKEAFRIVYRDNNTVSNPLGHTDLLNVNISSIRYATEGDDPADSTKANTTFKNVIYITLDPSFQYNNRTRNLYLLINDKFRYTGTAPVVTFGNSDNYLYDNFDGYSITLNGPSW